LFQEKTNEERCSRVPRLSDARYSAKGSKMEMETYKQQSEIVKRHLPAISMYGGG